MTLRIEAHHAGPREHKLRPRERLGYTQNIQAKVRLQKSCKSCRRGDASTLSCKRSRRPSSRSPAFVPSIPSVWSFAKVSKILKIDDRRYRIRQDFGRLSGYSLTFYSCIARHAGASHGLPSCARRADTAIAKYSLGPLCLSVPGPFSRPL